MENRAHALAAGLFVILLSMAVAAATVWFGGETVVRDRYLLVSEVPVTGLNPQAMVRYRGVSVGKVEDIRLDPENAHFIFVRIAVNRDVPLTKNTYAQLGYQGLTGLAFIQLNDDGKHVERMQTDANNLARIPLRPSALDNIADAGQHLLSNANELAGRLNTLLDEQNQTHIAHILKNMEGASGRLDNAIDQLPQLTTEASITLKHASQLMTDLNQVVAKINQQGGAVDSLSQTTQDLADTLPRLRDAADGITRSTRSVDRVLLQLEEQPRSLLFGRAPPPPGPGENGFVSPQSPSK